MEETIEQYYLCGIGAHNGIESFRVGRYDKKRDTFYFPNGSYGPEDLSKEPMGSNATHHFSQNNNSGYGPEIEGTYVTHYLCMDCKNILNIDEIVYE